MPSPLGNISRADVNRPIPPEGPILPVHSFSHHHRAASQASPPSFELSRATPSSTGPEGDLRGLPARGGGQRRRRSDRPASEHSFIHEFRTSNRIRSSSFRDSQHNPTSSFLSPGFAFPNAAPGCYDSDDSPMSRRIKKDSQKKKADPPPPSITSSTSPKGRSNGHATSDMDVNMELRKKQLSVSAPSSASHAAAIMGREGFSLNDEPPPTPQTPNPNASFFDLPRQDRRNFLLLVLLYFLQGIPMGLASGSVPFLLKEHLSYAQIGIFSLAAYPYSLKLFWSPIVDAVWSPELGRRKSWILPIQMFSGFGMIYLGGKVKDMMVAAGAGDGSGVWAFTWWWFMLVFLCATQDIAVDGWALTLISPQNLSYASTAQTVGLTGGHFLSYTVFLAFQSPDFANRWFRSQPSTEGLMTLGGYLTFWGRAYIVVTILLAILKKEDKTKERDGIVEVYKSMWSILKLRNIQSIIIIHLIAKIGFQANDAVTNLKLLDKGFSTEDMALTVLIDFPFEISLGYYAGRWSTSNPPIHVWCWAFIGRLIAAVVAQGVVMIFPANGVTPWYLLTVIASHIFSTFSSTVMFVAISAFHAKIADPAIGGTYMTLLATVSNLGGTFPRYFILYLVDYFTSATCTPHASASDPTFQANFIATHSNATSSSSSPSLITSTVSCVTEESKHACTAGLGTCTVQRDGYYFVNVACVIFGAVTFWLYIQPAARRLQSLPLRAWRLGWSGASSSSGYVPLTAVSDSDDNHNRPRTPHNTNNSNHPQGQHELTNPRGTPFHERTSSIAASGTNPNASSSPFGNFAPFGQGTSNAGPVRARIGSMARASVSGGPLVPGLGGGDGDGGGSERGVGGLPPMGRTRSHLASGGGGGGGGVAGDRGQGDGLGGGGLLHGIGVVDEDEDEEGRGGKDL